MKAGSNAPMTDAPEIPPPAIEDPKVEIHKPHAAKSWKEFFIELGTIVLGILIALGLEQSVEAFHERGLARDAEAAIHEEMAENASRMEYRLNNQGCIVKRLDEISALLAGWNNNKEIPAGLHVGWPGGIVFNDQRWQANLNSGRFSRENESSQSQQTFFYTLLHVVDGFVHEEMSAWDQLQALDQGSQFLTPAYRPRLVEATAVARAKADEIARLGGAVIRQARAANVRSFVPFHPVMPGTTCQPLKADPR
jgi:hypothetical protein